MKNLKYIFCSFLIFISLSFFSCQTFKFGIPGENSVIENNISAEYYSIASSYENLKNYSKAIEYYLLASKNKNLRASCSYKIARCYALNKDWENALKEYEKLLKQDPENTNLQISVAYIYAMSGNLEKSAQAYKELQSKNSTDVSILKNYISVLIAMENFDEAQNMFSYLKENFPDEQSISNFEKVLKDSQKSQNLENPSSENSSSQENQTENPQAQESQNKNPEIELDDFEKEFSQN